MDLVVLVVMTSVFLWALVSARAAGADLSAPIVFVAVGALLAAAELLDGSSTPEALLPLVEVTLVWVLFSDAARVSVREVRHDLGVYVRLLGVGLPLTILGGWALSVWFFPGLGLWLALVVGATLAPTDAALGVPVVTNPVVPSRVRRLITVESGLNDGIATPVVMLAIAGAASAEGVAGAVGLGPAVLELLLGAAVGAATGGAGGWLLRAARRREWAAEDYVGIAVLALALVAYVGAVSSGGNGFVAAFCGGMAFGATAGRRGESELRFLEQTSGLVSLFVWLAFGAIALPLVVDHVDLLTTLYAVLSLTLVRMVPVALALLGAGLDRGTVLFVGWFGPRGLASIVFSIIALDALPPEPGSDVVSIVVLTVLLSVVLHGATASPLARLYGAKVASLGEGDPEHAPLTGVAPVPRRMTDRHHRS
jgi:NhaP-type Na+/H+ or K+/H+ antiporter